MDILKIAVDSGMRVIADDVAGCGETRNVVGSLQALQKFANTLSTSVARESRSANCRSGAHDPVIDCPAIWQLVESDPLMLV